VNKINYQKELDLIIQRNSENHIIPTLLIHSCCAPCSSYVLEYLSNFFAITVVYYNPNIFPEEEYLYRISEQERLISSMKFKNPVKFISTEYTPYDFYNNVKGLEGEPEGGKRCRLCFNVRLEYTAKLAKENKFDFFTTTLSISPLKNSNTLNDIGLELAQKYGVKYLVSDFKKKNGYKRSVELSKAFELYRQDYCGCVYSKQEMDTKRNSCKKEIVMIK